VKPQLILLVYVDGSLCGRDHDADLKGPPHPRRQRGGASAPTCGGPRPHRSGHRGRVIQAHGVCRSTAVFDVWVKPLIIKGAVGCCGEMRYPRHSRLQPVIRRRKCWVNLLHRRRVNIRAGGDRGLVSR
jgi:hypothetical protein